MFKYVSMSHIDGNWSMRCVRDVDADGVDVDWCGE